MELAEKQILDWKTHFKSCAQSGDITVEHNNELQVICDLALRSLQAAMPEEPTEEMIDAAVALPDRIYIRRDYAALIYKAMYRAHAQGKVS